tara:strand:- start:119 stop:622 length:504 start_codon:yes stop_codon:yes gene_type:complete
MKTLVQNAIEFALERHAGQFRKYTGRPYFSHCQNVAELVYQKATKDDIPESGINTLVAAAYLHDILEDTETDYEELVELFGEEIAFYVYSLSDHYTPERYPDMNRKERKRHEAARLADAAKGLIGLRLIKWCDLTDNTRSIVEHDPKFSIVYLREKANVLEALGFGE